MSTEQMAETLKLMEEIVAGERDLVIGLSKLPPDQVLKSMPAIEKCMKQNDKLIQTLKNETRSSIPAV